MRNQLALTAGMCAAHAPRTQHAVPHVTPYAALPWAHEDAYQSLINKFEQEHSIFSQHESVFSNILQQASQLRGAPAPTGAKNKALEQALRESPYRKGLQTPQQQAPRPRSRSPEKQQQNRSRSPPKQQLSFSPPKSRPSGVLGDAAHQDSASESRPSSQEEHKFRSMSVRDASSQDGSASVERQACDQKVRGSSREGDSRPAPTESYGSAVQTTVETDKRRKSTPKKTQSRKASRDVLDQMSWSEWRRQVMREQDGTAEMEFNLRMSPWVANPGQDLQNTSDLSADRLPKISSPGSSWRLSKSNVAADVKSAERALRRSASTPEEEAYGALPPLRNLKSAGDTRNVKGAVPKKAAAPAPEISTASEHAGGSLAYGAVYGQSMRKQGGSKRRQRRRQAWAEEDGDKLGIKEGMPRSWRADVDATRQALVQAKMKTLFDLLGSESHVLSMPTAVDNNAPDRPTSSAPKDEWRRQVDGAEEARPVGGLQVEADTSFKEDGVEEGSCDAGAAVGGLAKGEEGGATGGREEGLLVHELSTRTSRAESAASHRSKSSSALFSIAEQAEGESLPASPVLLGDLAGSHGQVAHEAAILQEQQGPEDDEKGTHEPLAHEPLEGDYDIDGEESFTESPGEVGAAAARPSGLSPDSQAQQLTDTASRAGRGLDQSEADAAVASTLALGSSRSGGQAARAQAQDDAVWRALDEILGSQQRLAPDLSQDHLVPSHPAQLLENELRVGAAARAQTRRGGGMTSYDSAKHVYGGGGGGKMDTVGRSRCVVGMAASVLSGLRSAPDSACNAQCAPCALP